jgi:basic membrane lipoprotein Med (substrate-binding protein (PBP1-ABC) superfamily)
MPDKRKALTQLEGGLIVLVIILAALAGYAFVSKPPGGVVTQTTTVTQTGATALAISKLKVAMIVPITEADHSWNYQAEYSLKLLQQQYNFALSITENKFDGTAAQPVAEQYASQGYNVVFLQGIQYQVMASTIAPKYPNTLFVCVDCFAANYSNVYRIWLDLGQGGFILGVMAGLVSKTDTFGLIGGGRVPSIWAGHEGFKAGVLYALNATKPSQSPTFIEKYEAFSWADSAGAQRDATAAYNQGADVVFSSGDGIDVGVIGAAKSIASSTSKQVWATNVYTNLTAIDPTVNNVLLGSIVVNWAPLYNAALVDYVTGNWRWGFVTANMGGGMVKVQPGPNVPSNVKEIAKRLQDMFTQGALIMYFKTNPATGNPLCFDSPTLPQCSDNSIANTAAQFNFLPRFSSL